MSPRIPIHSLCAALLLLTGCQATFKANDWSAYDGPGRAYFEKEEIELPFIGDPLEPMNRGIADFNHGLMVWLASPTAGIYRLIFPEQIRTGIDNIFENLLYPLRLVTNLLQGKGGGAWRETKRFGVNTTIGIAGVLDSATARTSGRHSAGGVGEIRATSCSHCSARRRFATGSARSGTQQPIRSPIFRPTR
jgi:ABC-type transporter lipoprotein component MlaA